MMLPSDSQQMRSYPMLFLLFLIPFYVLFSAVVLEADDGYLSCWSGARGTAYNCHLDVVPSLPNDAEPLVISFQAEHSDSCIPDSAGANRQNREINIYLAHSVPDDIACLAVISPFSYRYDIGRLPAGTYRLNAYINDDMVESTTITVRAGRSKLFLPFMITQ